MTALRLLTACALLLASTAAIAADFQDLLPPPDGAEQVHNPATPLHPAVDLYPRELWRLDGADEDEVIGVVNDAVADTAGNVYLLDYQQQEVVVVPPAGGIGARLGHRGEGPGEFRRGIRVHAPDGAFLRTLRRDYEPRPRPARHVQELQDYDDEEFAGRMRRGFPMSYAVSPTDPDIEALFAREDGTLWVLPSRGAYDLPAGVLGIFDVFDPDGRFDHQTVVHGEGDFFHDKYFLSRGLLIVVRNVMVELPAERDDERKYEVICYRL